MYKKILILILTIVLAPIIGGIYGILNDQLTYSISPEYYTKFKFYQFGLVDSGNEAIFLNPRFEVSIVGIMATWWMGLLIGGILGFVGLIHNGHKRRFRITMKAILITIAVTFFIGLIGLFYGKFYLNHANVDWWLPKNLIETEDFIAVGSMHNFSYIGGLIGLIVGIVYSINQRMISDKRKL
ncbi:hypothetical protein [Zunongwangia pacifica]|uniref:Signal peptide-containing protein n=1 Tax=Zunongwangia pacifica TaxID=2911062 RepID=A0A9X1ZUN8_9FLAO|nr:hypothetical protein [Zunongwangia pacifica]MCL6220284.1 hypothetical protein [Zunongwangia pacifica]